jgi:hypothetical protein
MAEGRVPATARALRTAPELYRWTKASGVGWYFNKFFPYTDILEDRLFRVVETGLLEPWKKLTYAEMRVDYLAVGPASAAGQSATQAREEGGAGTRAAGWAALGLQDLLGAFIFLGLGFAVSTIVHIAHIALLIIADKLAKAPASLRTSSRTSSPARRSADDRAN